MATIGSEKRASAATDQSSKRQRVEPAALVMFGRLNDECVLNILDFLHFSDLNKFGSCSKECKSFRNAERLDQTREAIISFGRNNHNDVIDLIQTFARWQLQGKFGEKRRHLKILPHSHLDRIEAVPMREVNRVIKSRNRLITAFTHVTSLDVAVQKFRGRRKPPIIKVTVFKTFALLFPNLKILDMSYTNVAQAALACFSKQCPLLETIKWDGSDNSIFVTGHDFSNSANLKEVSFENAHMYDGRRRSHGEPPLLAVLCAQLRKVNVKGAMWNRHGEAAKAMSQDMLIAFVRSSPQLVWFKSDCSPETVATLQAERPEISFC